MKLLVLNVGSSSLKFGAYADIGKEPRLLAEGVMADGEASPWHDVPSLHDLGTFDVVAHRIVHGGPWLRDHCLIDRQVVERIEAAADFAPLHVPAALRWIRRAQEAFPRARQVACLDTAFHYPLPDLSRFFPLPYAWRALGIERFGFHGLSCESILHQLNDVPSRLVIAHLGGGASLTALQDGRSVDTSMGMTPAGGFMMGTRSGDIDPGILLFLMRKHGMGLDELEHGLERESGLRGLSNESADIRELMRNGAKPLAELAVEHFARDIARWSAAFAVVLGGLDTLIFTGGIGEHHAPTRDRVTALLRPCFPLVDIHVLPSQENHAMARHAMRLAAAL
ncbi:MAG TPA: acetate/propionate family kinase [Dyella sp.]|uniref:acetate/propionate family kinase n=1 Tax=Dyella sp. TaxID=1869338 RepID=UPI002F929A85